MHLKTTLLILVTFVYISLPGTDVTRDNSGAMFKSGNTLFIRVSVLLSPALAVIVYNLQPLEAVSS